MNLLEIEAREATRRVLDLILRRGSPIVLVDSPPGTGKTRLVEDVVGTAVNFGLRVGVVMPKAEQTYDFLRRVTSAFARLRVELLQSAERALPDDIGRNTGVRVVNRATQLEAAAGLVVSTVDKLAFSMPDCRAGMLDLLICDEAYQVSAKSFHPLLVLAQQVLLVGDPGQLPPLIKVDTSRFEAAAYKVHWAIPKEMLDRLPDMPVVRLPATRRLPPETAELIQPCFYPDLPFASAARRRGRRIKFSTAGRGDVLDRAFDRLEDGATMMGIELPEPDLPGAEIDEEVTDAMAEVVRRLLDRGVAWQGRRRLTARDIGCVDPQVASGAAIRRSLQARGLSPDAVMVDTPEIWQGLERPIMVVRHPLSGKSRLSSFDLDPGRWCVSLSRHQLACIIVGRRGLEEALVRHEHDCSDRPLGGGNVEWAGWQSHLRLWTELSRRRQILRIY